ncbi:MAG: hypothetical protein JWP29_1528 [Rhodoferax sp.]|nr:hypothetical protein [Rhodoferax sp.]
MYAFLKPSFTGCAALLIVGCANNVAVKDVLGNPAEYLTTLTPATLRTEVVASLPRGEPPLEFKQIDFQTEVAEIRNDQTPERVVTTKSVFVNVGNGLLRSYDELSTNGVPFRINYKLSYRGFLPLKWQPVFLNRSNADMMQEMKSLKRIDSLPGGMTMGGTLQYELTFGSQMQLANFREGKDVCTVGAIASASDLNPNLEGKWTELSCVNYGSNGQLLSRSTYAYLNRYGLTLLRSFVDSASQSTHKLRSIQIQQ